MNKFDTIFFKDEDYDGTSVGIYPQKNGTYLALTTTWSKYFKTYNGAERAILKRYDFSWLKK